MSAGRGAFIVFEGCDRAGKSTQVKLLVEALNKLCIPVEARAFPDRTSKTGVLIDDYLSKRNDCNLQTIHLIFSANRWECRDKMVKTLRGGTNLIVDRYASSGAAYCSATTGKDLFLCKVPDRGLPKPDMTVLLKVSEECQKSRNNWGDERFEKEILQKKVAHAFEMLKDDSWCVIDANQDQTKIHSEILEKVLPVIERVKNENIGELYASYE